MSLDRYLANRSPFGLALTAPAWLNRVSDINPLKHVVNGIRAEFLGDLTTPTALWGYVLTAALVVVGVWVGTRTFRREDR
jgi:ABC-2 type transport system permease protein